MCYLDNILINVLLNYVSFMKVENELKYERKKLIYFLCYRFLIDYF